MRVDNEKEDIAKRGGSGAVPSVNDRHAKIKQDTIVHRPQRKKVTEVAPKRLLQEQADNSHYFSDEFQPLLNTEGSTKYVRAGRQPFLS
ncbi:peptidase S10 [Klebsiella variicola]|uniref:Peptidase S10 n=1 Tax=Klebsiella variicola TaxID=244366 RepID=A0A7H4MPU5_KLEVA|nr:peptidase S10 [Klebsiella variicola]